MENGYQANVTYFILEGILDIPNLQVIILLIILSIYIIILGGNLTILLLVCLDHHLHTPMYFFLGNLSIIDMSSTTAILYKVISTFILQDNTISSMSCFTQMYVVLSFTADELCILTAMSYDRYVAICNPLLYSMVMTHKICILLAIICWALSFLHILPYFIFFSNNSCYRSNIINHFYCDLVPLIELVCTDISSLKILMFTEGTLFGAIQFFLTFSSYIFIISTIMKIRSTTGRRKAFYTCSSHLTVVVLLYVTLFGLYLRPNSTNGLESNKLFSLFNLVAVPVLNPLIYSLKNKDVKSAFRRQMTLFKLVF